MRKYRISYYIIRRFPFLQVRKFTDLRCMVQNVTSTKVKYAVLITPINPLPRYYRAICTTHPTPNPTSCSDVKYTHHKKNCTLSLSLLTEDTNQFFLNSISSNLRQIFEFRHPLRILQFTSCPSLATYSNAVQMRRFHNTLTSIVQ